MSDDDHIFLYDVLKYIEGMSDISENYPMNLTATQPPIVDKETIALFIDGLFYDTFEETSHVNPTKINY